MCIAGLTRWDNLRAQGRFAGADDGFIASFAPDSRRLRFATYFGGMGFDIFEGVAIAPDGTVCATGLTSSLGLGTSDYRGGRSDPVLVRVDDSGQVRLDESYPAQLANHSLLLKKYTSNHHTQSSPKSMKAR
jgi:hypothetical protein